MQVISVLNNKILWVLFPALWLMLAASVILANQQADNHDMRRKTNKEKSIREQCFKFVGHKMVGGRIKGDPGNMVPQYQWDNECIKNYHRAILIEKNTNQATETTKSSFLKSTFNKLSKESRKLVQQRLADLDLYSSAIDGLYGKGTKAAISSYNKEYFASVDLNKKDNVDALLEAIVVHKSVLAKTGSNTDDTEQKICSSANLKLCSVEELCSNGTKQVSGQLQWVTNTFADAGANCGHPNDYMGVDIATFGCTLTFWA